MPNESLGGWPRRSVCGCANTLAAATAKAPHPCFFHRPAAVKTFSNSSQLLCCWLVQVDTPLRNTLAATTAKTLRRRFSAAGGKDANGETVVRISGAGEEPDFTATAQRTASGVLLMTLGFELMLITCERWHRCTGRLSTAPVRHLASDFFQGLAA